jgi:hypothetical protein
LALAAAATPGAASADGEPADAGVEAAPPTAADLAALRAELEEHRAKLEALEASDTRKEVERQEPPLRVYGFMDLGIQKLFVRDSSPGSAILQSASTSFVLGNVNLYFDAQPVDGWRGLVEVRLTNLPNGTDIAGYPGSPYRRTTTEVFDPTSTSGGWSVIRWGALILERAHIDWRHSDHLTVRAGVFLTPAGIWNVDHGTPTLIALQMPGFLVLEMFPPRQTGLQIFGTHLMGPWALDYTAYVSNGRVAQQLDPTEDKAVGGRLVLRRAGKRRLALGTSFYVNRFSDHQREITQLEPFTSERIETVAFDEITVGVDASLDVGALRLRSEGAFRHVVYDDGKHATWQGFPGFYMSNRNEIDVYALFAYRLPWWGLEPYVNLEFQKTATPLGEGQIIPSVGANVHFTAATQLKVQVSRTYFWGEWANPDHDVTFAAARVVLAF